MYLMLKKSNASEFYKYGNSEETVLLKHVFFPTKKDTEVIGLIANWYKLKYGEEAKNKIKEVGFESIRIVEDKVHITCSRVGILIGKRGELIDSLSEYLNMKIHIEESMPSVEDELLYALYHIEDKPVGE